MPTRSSTDRQPGALSGRSPSSRRQTRWPTRLRQAAAATLLTVVVLAGAAQPVNGVTPKVLTPQKAVDEGVTSAGNDGVNQYIALVDRRTGKLVASSGGDHQVISESIVKLFTVAFYLVKYHGDLPPAMAADLHEMIVHSNDTIESRYWTTAAVPAMAARYGLPNTANGPKTGPHDWGWEYITANDEAKFLYESSVDPVVGPFLEDAMANVAPVGADGFDQTFGFNSLGGDHGSKQGWTDRNTSAAINVHSVGWTDGYFGAILETSGSPRYDAMRADSTKTADLIANLDSPAHIAAAQVAAAREAVAARLQATSLAAERSAIERAARTLRAAIDYLLTVIGLHAG